MKQGVVEAPDASDKISRKQFEKELGKLQVELTGCRLGSRTRGRASLWFSRAGTRRVRGSDQPNHRTHEPARLPAHSLTCPLRPPEDPSLHPTLHRAIPS